MCPTVVIPFKWSVICETKLYTIIDAFSPSRVKEKKPLKIVSWEPIIIVRKLEWESSVIWWRETCKCFSQKQRRNSFRRSGICLWKSGFVSGKTIKQKRANYSKLRKKLQMRQTPSSRRRLKAIGQRENRWMQDVNHCVSKALVENNPKHTLFVLEDLSGIRNVIERVRI